MDWNQIFNFSGKVAVITGGGGVLCGAMAKTLAGQGAQVAILDQNLSAAKRVADSIQQLGGEACALQADVLDKSSLVSACEVVQSAYGHIDILINGAGGAKKEATTSDVLSFFDLPEEAVRWVMDLNFLGTFLPCQVFGGLMAKLQGGCILNVASVSAMLPLTRNVAYSAAKAAVVNFTQWLAVYISQEYASCIRVNAIAPGFFLTEQNRFLLTDEKTGAVTERGRRIIDHTPLGRFGQPEELLGTVLYVLSDGATYLHGATIHVDGGFTAYSGV